MKDLEITRLKARLEQLDPTALEEEKPKAAPKAAAKKPAAKKPAAKKPAAKKAPAKKAAAPAPKAEEEKK